MARRLIGLDIGTNAVTVAEVRPGEPPRLDMFGQVALGARDDARRRGRRRRGRHRRRRAAARRGRPEEGRPYDSDSRAREWSSARSRCRRCRATSSASALQFQAAELIPIPLDDAVLDFAILGPAEPG